MKIDIWRGTVSFDAGDICRGCNISTFLRTPIGASSNKTLVNAGWVHYEFAPEAGVLATALFRDDHIDRLFLFILMPHDGSKDWSDWSEQQELDRKDLHDNWLRAELGAPPYKYAWGVITSDYDPKSGSSEIIVSYAK